MLLACYMAKVLVQRYTNLILKQKPSDSAVISAFCYQGVKASGQIFEVGQVLQTPTGFFVYFEMFQINDADLYIV